MTTYGSHIQIRAKSLPPYQFVQREFAGPVAVIRRGRYNTSDPTVGTEGFMKSRDLAEFNGGPFEHTYLQQ